MNLDLLAERAYTAYAEYLGISKTPGYKPWGELSPLRQTAWRVVARAVMDTATGAA